MAADGDAWLSGLVVAVVAVFVAGLAWRLRRRSSGAPVAVVLVLGDFGRSPRMQYHTLSLAAAGRRVHVVAFAGAAPLAAIAAHPHIVLHLLPPPWALPSGLPRVCFLAYAPVKVAVQVRAAPNHHACVC